MKHAWVHTHIITHVNKLPLAKFCRKKKKVPSKRAVVERS